VDKGKCVTVTRYTRQQYILHTQKLPRDTLSGVSCSETKLTLVMQTVHQILLLELQFFFVFCRGGSRQYVRETKGTEAWRKREVSLIGNGDPC
jgi:hypothetical protein